LSSDEEPAFVAFEIVMTVLLVWNCFEIPFRIAFLPFLKANCCFSFYYLLIHKQPLPYQFLIVAALVDWCFVLDCCVRFFRPYLHPRGYVVRSPTEIRRHYVKTWFVLDVVSSIPWDFMTLCMTLAAPALLASQEFWLRYKFEFNFI
jgi:hypothetical protein